MEIRAAPILAETEMEDLASLRYIADCYFLAVNVRVNDG